MNIHVGYLLDISNSIILNWIYESATTGERKVTLPCSYSSFYNVFRQQDHYTNSTSGSVTGRSILVENYSLSQIRYYAVSNPEVFFAIGY